MHDNPLTDLVASNVLNLIAIHGDFRTQDDFNKLHLDTNLEELGIDKSIKEKIFHEFEKALGVVYVGEDKYKFEIQTAFDEIVNVADMIKAVIDAMSDIVKKAS